MKPWITLGIITSLVAQSNAAKLKISLQSQSDASAASSAAARAEAAFYASLEMEAERAAFAPPVEYLPGDVENVKGHCYGSPQISAWVNRRAYILPTLCQEVKMMTFDNPCAHSLRRMEGRGVGGGKSALYVLHAACWHMWGNQQEMMCTDFQRINGCPDTMTNFSSWAVSCGGNCNVGGCCVWKKDECKEQTHNCNAKAICKDTDNSFTCTCNAGYYGDGVLCKDMDECVLSNPTGMIDPTIGIPKNYVQKRVRCHKDGHCENTIGSFQCVCNAGYSGDGSANCVDVDECGGTNNCHVAGACLNTVGSYICQCPPGYEGNGITCLPSNCNNIPAPDNGMYGNCSIVLPHGAMCMHDCKPGYSLSRPSSCRYGSLTQGYCTANSCNAGDPPENGLLGGCTSTLESGGWCRAACNVGYTLSSATTCFAGELQSGKCVAQDCDDISAPRNGVRGNCSANLKHQEICEPACNRGYGLTRPTTCLLGSLDEGVCGPLSCNAGTPPVNGGPGDCTNILTSGGSCMPQCDAGFIPDGPTQCNLGVLYPTKCVPSTCDASSPPQNGELGDCNDRLVHGQTCRVRCNAGYQPQGVSTCNHGILTSSACEPKGCPAESFEGAPMYGNAGSCTGSLKHGAVCTPTCNAGYTLDGWSECWAGAFKPAKCVANDCGWGTIPSSGTPGNCTGPMVTGQACFPKCNAGYTLNGATSCNLGRLQLATCSPQHCMVLVPPDNGRLGNCNRILHSGGTCIPDCDVGYELTGEFSCNHGQLVRSYCRKVHCEVLKPPKDGDFGDCQQEMESGTTCTPSCRAGFELTAQLTCMDSRLNHPSCSPKSCDASALPNNAYIGDCTADLAHNSSCAPMCKAGYYLQQRASCEYGVLKPGKCEPRACYKVTPPEHATQGDCPSTMTQNQICRPTCNTGYSLVGVTSCALGQASPGTCVPRPCDISVAPLNGRFGLCGAKLQHGETCTPACDPGYRLNAPTICHFGQLISAKCEVCVITEYPNTFFNGDNGGNMKENSDGRGDYKDGIVSSVACAVLCNGYGHNYYSYRQVDGRCWCKSNVRNGPVSAMGYISGHTCKNLLESGHNHLLKTYTTGKILPVVGAPVVQGNVGVRVDISAARIPGTAISVPIGTVANVQPVNLAIENEGHPFVTKHNQSNLPFSRDTNGVPGFSLSLMDNKQKA
eukprot:TRINITY_DN63744_c0_g1_i1.p1 TRINITY_DN63744_c0_g1~~TRINITY_DN63744_c0_g1_i1.p1  ORF type:complete len:1177 (-),score=140.24 TRINITY_DN63744_c0_g1_i1:126-3656(-)